MLFEVITLGLGLWQSPQVSVQAGTLYWFVPETPLKPTGFALEWHQTFEQLPFVQEIAGLRASFPVAVGAFAYAGEAAEPRYGFA